MVALTFMGSRAEKWPKTKLDAMAVFFNQVAYKATAEWKEEIVYFDQFKPVVAIVVIAGVCLGKESGFLVGAMTAFVSNFIFGQGPWTPWQMFCWGLLGFLAGLIFNKVDLEKLKSRDFKIILGPVLCIVFALIAAYISYLIVPGEDNTFFGWRLYAFGAAGLLAGILLQRKRLPVDIL